MFELASEVNRTQSGELAAQLKSLGAVLGLLQSQPEVFLQAGAAVKGADIVERIAQRQAAKAARDFALADAIRQELLGQGIVLKDTPQGTTWEVAAP